MSGTALILGARDLCRAIAEHLAGRQEATAWTHELQVTPRGDGWVP